MSKPAPPLTVGALTAAIGQIVEAIDGPARAYFEVGSERIEYQHWKVAAVGLPEDTEVLLCTWFWLNFVVPFTEEMIEDRAQILFWRLRPQLVGFIDSQGRECTAIRARFACPGVKFSHGLAVSAEGCTPFLN